MQKGEVEGGKTRGLRRVTIAEGPLPKRALQPIDSPPFVFEQANAAVEVANAGKMGVETTEIAVDGWVHRGGASGRGKGATRFMAALAKVGPELTLFFYHVNR